MAESNHETMARLDRMEAAMVHITDLLVLHSERMDALRDEVRATREETRVMRETLTDRLDRLIDITMRERTTGVERLASIEARLARLEQRVGI